jgi:GDP-4-dehydro-6-deoxy-D-mannose reductase
VDALLRLLDAGVAGEVYNICGGHGTRLSDVLEALRLLVRVPVALAEDPALLRPLEQRVKIGDPRKLRALGWVAQVPLDDTVRSILDYWRTQ